jgi:hypothetical protein
MMKRSKQLVALIAISIFIAGAATTFGQGQTQQRKQSQHTIRDANGDGTCDICGQRVGSGQMNAQGKKATQGKHWGPADGTGNQGSGPKDGTGYGSSSGKRSGPQDGTGPYHQSGSQGRGQGTAGGRRGGR